MEQVGIPARVLGGDERDATSHLCRGRVQPATDGAIQQIRPGSPGHAELVHGLQRHPRAGGRFGLRIGEHPTRSPLPGAPQVVRIRHHQAGYATLCRARRDLPHPPLGAGTQAGGIDGRHGRSEPSGGNGRQRSDRGAREPGYLSHGRRRPAGAVDRHSPLLLQRS